MSTMATTWGICKAPAPASNGRHVEWCGEDAPYLVNGEPRCRDCALFAIDELAKAVHATEGVVAINVIGAAPRAAFDSGHAARVLANVPGSVVFVLRCAGEAAHELHETPHGAAALNNTPCPLCAQPMHASCVLVAS